MTDFDATALRRFFANDRFAALLGIELLDMAPGRATVRLEIGASHLNGIGIVHGGVLFALADLAFAVASNAHGQVAVGINASIAYFKGVASGTLYAEAREIDLNPKLATYAIRIYRQDDETLASFQGTVYRKRDRIA